MTSYQWNAEDYEKFSSQQAQWARELAAKLQLEGSESLLDIGCGDGKITAELASMLHCGSVLGIDNSAEMVQLARQRHPPEKIPNLRFQKEDARCLPYLEQFSVVFSNAALHWIRGHSPVLQGISRSLKAGGKCLLQMGGRGNAVQVVAVFDQLACSAPWSRYFESFDFPYGFYGPEDYSTWLDEAGLKPLRLELIPRDNIQEGREGLAGWIRTTWLPYTQQVPPALRETFLNEFLDYYLQQHPIDRDGLVHVAMVRLEVEAVKG